MKHHFASSHRICLENLFRKWLPSNPYRHIETATNRTNYNLVYNYLERFKIPSALVPEMTAYSLIIIISTNINSTLFSVEPRDFTPK